MRGDGDGWVTCGRGHRHWGRGGAAGLLVRTPAGDAGRRQVLVQLRVAWSHHGGTWGVPGGARDSDETVRQTALREAAEEAGVLADLVSVAAVHVDDHGGWTYTTVLADATAPFTVEATSPESAQVRWVAEHAVAALPLHPGFAASWPLLRDAPYAPAVVVDAANVMGARPDGWWRDRLGAARRLRDTVAVLRARGVDVAALPWAGDAPHDPSTWYPEVVYVVEGAARPLAAEPGPAGVRTVAAGGSGDDAIVSATADLATDDGRTVVVVTADRELRGRCTSTGPRVVTRGPDWLYSVAGAGRGRTAHR